MNLEKEADARVDRLWRIGRELDTAPPARLRELANRMVDRIELRFGRVVKGKRTECPFLKGTIHLRRDPLFFSLVNRGNWRSFEPALHEFVAAFLAPEPHLVVAERLAKRVA